MIWFIGANCCVSVPWPGLDGSAPIGPVLVSPSAMKDPHKLAIKAIHNGTIVQDSNTRYVSFFELS